MNTVILGGGIAGLLGAYAFRKHKPTIIEASGQLGGNFAAGGLKYIHDTAEVRQLLRELAVPFEQYQPRGRIWLNSHALPHPEAMAQASPHTRYQVQLQHWEKTRGTQDGIRSDCMNDPMGSHAALRCDHEHLLRSLEVAVRDAGCEIRLGARVVGIDAYAAALGGQRWVQFSEGNAPASVSYDVLIPTLPIGMLANISPTSGLPNSTATKLAIFTFESRTIMDWDYMYTPQTKWITRMVHARSNELMVEVPWYLPQSESIAHLIDAVPELLRILKEDFQLDCTWSGGALAIPGHLRPLERQPVWPVGWYPLGRFAQWDSRATADKVYARALSIASSHA